MDDLLDLERLALVSKITSELKTHIGVDDTTVAEFVIAQRLDSNTFDEFKKKMNETSGGSLPPSLVESIDRFVRIMHPSMKPKMPARNHESTTKKTAQNFPGLALPDHTPTQDPFEDVFSTLEALEPSHRNANSRARKRNRSRSRSSSRSRSRSRSLGRMTEHHSRSKRRDRSPHKERQLHQQRRTRHGRSEHDTQQERESRHRRPTRTVDNAPILQKVYDGHVTGVKDFGAFVAIQGIQGNLSGLVHISRLADGRVEHASDVVERGQSVKVKVVSIDGSRIGLSMDDVNQETGLDLAPQATYGSGSNLLALGGGKNSHADSDRQYPAPIKRQRKRMTSPERWEIRQLIASGVVKASDYAELNEDFDMTDGNDNMTLEEDLDIEVREEEPPFLVGQKKQSLELSPIRVIKAPEGSLNRAAMSGTALAKERKELQRQEAEAAAKEQATTDRSTQWNDPMANSDNHGPASNMRGSKVGPSKVESTPEWKLAVNPRDQSYGKRVNMPIKEQRRSLPVFVLRDQLIESVRQHQILIVVGETGSGKTTQTTQYLAEAGFANNGIIGCTQPRRVAAISVAKRVAEEVGCVLGEEVGYSIRFEDRTSASTRIKYMTDGMLQREIVQDPELKRYSVIMLDEAHERTIATDVLFALLKKALKKRLDLKVIVTSATLNAEKFSTYFNDAPIFTIPGRTYPVEILYSREPESDYLDAALTTILQIHLTEPAGDILLFLTGQEEIDTSCEILYERMKAFGPSVPELIILPIYSALPTEMQSRIFEPAQGRKVVIATNIAETSITIDNIYYVVDPGFVKQKAYDPKLCMDSLIITPISQAQANQRAGRAGRTGPGKCFRLYTETAYQSEMLPTTIPDIQRQNISTTILMLKAMGINDLLNFDFMDPPPINATLTALEELYAIGALDDAGLLTSLGRKMTHFPMDPPLAKVVLAAVELGCSDEMISIVAMLTALNVFYRPKDKQEQADQKKAKFHDAHGDHLTLLNVYNSWKQNGYANSWCFENFIQMRSMKQAKNVRDQLVTIMNRYRHPMVSCGRETDKVRRALCAGFFRNTARRDASAGAGCYKTVVEGTAVYLHPSSALFGKSAEWVVYHELVLTTREYMHWCTTIEPKWLVEEVPTFFKITGVDGTMSKRRQKERIQPLFDRFSAEDDWRLSTQRKSGRGGGGTWG
ncbi:helicase associated domain-containing protein [Clohesyomyces aquaticus]|uniref:RNA helicase n=1 Tax=Clohesyomyces aquaticus TaxID=1231657 RepID=A0A1Y1Y6S7_9PLEO|nr:helicase associated domain-containing protein [Clohesyomyces aquaticus]